MSVIDDKYASLPDAAGLLGSATSPEGDALNGGRYRHYEFGSIYWQGITGWPAYVVMGDIRTKWAATGYERGPLGYPISDELAGGGGGRYSRFQAGAIYWRPDLGAHDVYGEIAKKYAITGYELGPLGYPTTDESDAVGGRFNHFEHGSIYWRFDLGAFEVHGEIHRAWADQGYERGGLGYPVTDETASLLDSVRWSGFEHGWLCWDPNNAAMGVFPVYPHQNCLLVVTPQRFRPALDRLVQHKRQTGTPTFVIDVDTVSAARIGRDDAEGIKRLIWDAWSTLQVKYVLLVGDGSLLPVRYRWTSGAPGWSDSWYTCADLYYAALTSGHSIVNGAPEPAAQATFDDWDANQDGRYNEHHWAEDIVGYNPDRVEGCADVAVGRIPAHSEAQVATYVNKVIGYETGQTRPDRAQGKITVLVDFDYDASGQVAYTLQRSSGSDLTVRYVAINQGTKPFPTLPGVPAANWSPAGTTPAQDAATATAWIAWVGHGYTTGWNMREGGSNMDVNEVATFSNSTSLPIVFAAGCDTGMLVPNPPTRGSYQGADGLRHSFHATPDGSRAPAEPTVHVWDDGDHPTDHVSADGNWIRLTPPPPDQYDLPGSTDTSMASAWLFNPHGGSIVYFGEQTVAPDNWGTDLGAGILTQFGGFPVLGDMWLYGQQQYWIRHKDSNDPIGAARIYLGYMTMYGDPSLRLH